MALREGKGWAKGRSKDTEWLRTGFASASRAHLDWLQKRLRERLGLRGWIWWDAKRGKGIGVLAYGKHDSVALLRYIYADPLAPCLARKRSIWDSYEARSSHALRERPSKICA